MLFRRCARLRHRRLWHPGVVAVCPLLGPPLSHRLLRVLVPLLSCPHSRRPSMATPAALPDFEFKSHEKSCVGLLPCSSWRPRRGQCHRCSLSCGCRESVRPAPLSTPSPLPLAFSSARSALSFDLTTLLSTPRPAAALTPVVFTPPFVASAGCLAGSWPLARPCECVASRPQA